MKILICHDYSSTYVSGSVRFTSRLVDSLSERGHSLLVLCPSPSSRFMRWKERGVEYVGIPSRPYFGPKGHRVCFSSFSNKKKIEEVLLSFRPDVIHTQGHVFLPKMLIELAHENAIPVVATSHFMVENIFYYSPLQFSFVKKLIAWWVYKRRHRVFKKAGLICSPTQTAAQVLKATSSIEREVHAVSCGVDLSVFKPGAPSQSFQENYRLPDGPLALYVGRLEREKHLEVLIQAFSLALKVTPCTLLLAGKGVDESRLKKLARDLHIEDQILFLGFVPDEDLPSLYASADFFVMPSTAELQSIVTMEAMATGLPVLAANAVALPELVHPNKNGFLFEPGNVEELAEYLVRLASDAKLRARMAKASLRAISKHDFESTVLAYESIYESIVSSGRSFVKVSSPLPIYLFLSLSVFFLGVGTFSYFLDFNGYFWILGLLYGAFAHNPGSRFLYFCILHLKDFMNTLSLIQLISFSSALICFFSAFFVFSFSERRLRSTGQL